MSREKGWYVWKTKEKVWQVSWGWEHINYAQGKLSDYKNHILQHKL